MKLPANLKTIITLLLLIILPCGCTGILKKRGTAPVVKLLKQKEYPHFNDDMFFDVLAESINQSIEYYKKFPMDKTFVLAEKPITIERLLNTLEVFKAFIDKNPSSSLLNKFIAQNFDIYQSTGRNNDGAVLFTGYYEPSLRGSLTLNERYNVPVFAKPDDLVVIDLSLFTDQPCPARYITGRFTDTKEVVPYYERREIGNGTPLFGKAEVLAWVDDPVDLFFLEIQGSGIINLDQGESLRVHYHAKNGHAYKSIGRLLINTEKIPKEEMSMQRLKQYLTEHPEEVADILNYNSSYVFFKLEDGGPFGCYNAKVTPERSIATDKGLFPPCGLSFIKTEKPLIDGNGRISSWIPFSRFVLNQDTGGAIKGPGRADLFKGNGDYAEIAAGHMNHMGEMYFLILKDQIQTD